MYIYRLPVYEHISKEDFDRIPKDLEDLKLFAHGEILSIEADGANKQKYHITESPIRIDCDRESLVRNLQERIFSFEKQLQDKQYIIARLLDLPRHHSPNTTTTPCINLNEIKSYAPSASALKEQKQDLSRMHAAETKPIESAKEACNKNRNNKDAKNQHK